MTIETDLTVDPAPNGPSLDPGPVDSGAEPAARVFTGPKPTRRPAADEDAETGPTRRCIASGESLANSSGSW